MFFHRSSVYRKYLPALAAIVLFAIILGHSTTIAASGGDSWVVSTDATTLENVNGTGDALAGVADLIFAHGQHGIPPTNVEYRPGGEAWVFTVIDLDELSGNGWFPAGDDATATAFSGSNLSDQSMTVVFHKAGTFRLRVGSNVTIAAIDSNTGLISPDHAWTGSGISAYMTFKVDGLHVTIAGPSDISDGCDEVAYTANAEGGSGTYNNYQWNSLTGVLTGYFIPPESPVPWITAWYDGTLQGQSTITCSVDSNANADLHTLNVSGSGKLAVNVWHQGIQPTHNDPSYFYYSDWKQIKPSNTISVTYRGLTVTIGKDQGPPAGLDLYEATADTASEYWQTYTTWDCSGGSTPGSMRQEIDFASDLESQPFGPPIYKLVPTGTSAGASPARIYDRDMPQPSATP